MSAGKILVVRGGALGDFILTFPALAALRRHFPRPSLEILGYPRIASLAVADGLADRVLPLESPALAGFFVSNGSWPASAAEYFAGFDLIVAYIYDPKKNFQRNVACASPARFIAAPHRPNETLNQHATDFFLQPLKALGIENANSCPRLMLPASTPFAEGGWLAVHPGSGSESKNWPEANWAQLLQQLARQTPWNFFLISGEAEADRGRRLSALLPAGRARLAESLPLVELAQEMKCCRAFIGHDSGITHLAAALDLPGLVLWGPSSAAIWRPRGAKMRLLQHPGGLSALPIQTVVETVATAFPQT
jgi:ADP-heptose:LPS heptosyltransferase